MSAQEFSRQRAVDVAVGGRYSLANWYDPQGNRREYACRTSRISPFQMLVAGPLLGLYFLGAALASRVSPSSGKSGA